MKKINDACGRVTTKPSKVETELCHKMTRTLIDEKVCNAVLMKAQARLINAQAEQLELANKETVKRLGRFLSK